MEPGDVPSGDTLGFMWITMWASSEEDFYLKLKAYLATYRWNLLGTENTTAVDLSGDYGDERNRMIDETLRDRNRIALGTFFSYKPN